MTTDEESIVLKPRDPFTDILLSQNTDELARFMEQPTTAIAELLTGALAAGPIKVWTVMTGRIVQSILKGRLFQQVNAEIKQLREQGKISEDYADEKKNKNGFRSWVDLMTVIDEQTPDADRLEALKAMFFGINRIGATDGERILHYQLFQIAKALTSGELLLLRGMFECRQKCDPQPATELGRNICKAILVTTCLHSTGRISVSWWGRT